MGELAVAPAASGAAEHTAAPLLHITYYTDPLCSWSWAFEPQWRRLRYELGDQLGWRYCMGGMIPDWQHFSDPLNDVSRPMQMGPQWYQVSALSGMPLNDAIWFTNPPDSSYPACLAVKAAEQQGAAVGECYLRRLRRAVMVEGRNIAAQAVLLAAGEETPGLDPARLRRDLESEQTRETFRNDLKEVRWRQIGRFPTLILRHHAGKSIIIVGYRPYEVLHEAIGALAPELELRPSLPKPADALTAYVRHWGEVTTREAAELMDGDRDVAMRELAALATAGVVRRVEVAQVRQPLWAAN
jgi:predicted DsbA family dithiol-disulfide isomerase